MFMGRAAFYVAGADVSALAACQVDLICDRDPNWRYCGVFGHFRFGLYASNEPYCTAQGITIAHKENDRWRCVPRKIGPRHVDDASNIPARQDLLDQFLPETPFMNAFDVITPT